MVKRRVIKNVRLDAGGLLPGESRVTDWKGGRLRVLVRQPKIVEGVPLRDLPIQEVEWQDEQEYVPFGSGGFALPQPLQVELPPVGLALEIEIRHDRPVCVGLRSLKDGPALTTTYLKSSALPALGREVNEIVAEQAVRLVRTAEGEVVGLRSFSTSDIRTSRADRAADVTSALEQTARRRRMTDSFLEEVTTVYRDARATGRSTARAIAEQWDTTEENARRWVSHARRRGFLPPTEPRKARG